MTKTKQDKQAPEREPDLTSTLTLVQLTKAKKSEARSGWVLKFTAPLDNAAMNSEDESEVKRPLFGILELTRISLFADPDAPQTPEATQKALREKEKDPKHGNVKMAYTCKLKRRHVGARKDSPAFSIWTATLSNCPEEKFLRVLIDMACADGDPAQASVTAEFFEKAENSADEPKGPELFEESEQEEMSEEDKKLLEGTDGFDQGAESNRLPQDPKTGEFKKPESLEKGEFEAAAEEKKGKKRRKVEAA